MAKDQEVLKDREVLKALMEKLCSEYDPDLVYRAAKYAMLEHGRAPPRT